VEIAPPNHYADQVSADEYNSLPMC
jgi:hypothetical protein